LRSAFGRQCVVESEADGMSRVRVSAQTETIIARQLAGWGELAVVLEPASVRAQLAVIGSQLMAAYGGET
jgi:predicted DNA-binding transcriptional regulator YafY